MTNGKEGTKLLESDVREFLIGELRKKFMSVGNLDHLLDIVLDEVNWDSVSRDRFISLGREQKLVVLGRLLSMKLLQETFRVLSETDRFTFKTAIEERTPDLNRMGCWWNRVAISVSETTIKRIEKWAHDKLADKEAYCTSYDELISELLKEVKF